MMGFWKEISKYLSAGTTEILCRVSQYYGAQMQSDDLKMPHLTVVV